MSRHAVLTVAILAGLVLGLVFGEVLVGVLDSADHAGAAETLKFLGEATFMGWLKMVLIPLVASSVVVGVASIDPTHLGRLGSATVGYYAATMIMAVVLGVTLVSLIQPGANFNQAFRDQQVAQYESQTQQMQSSAAEEGVSGEHGLGLAVWGATRRLVRQMIPTNPIRAAASGDVLAVIIFSIILGIVLSVIGQRGAALLGVFQALFSAVMTLVGWIIWLAPIGVFFLTAYSVLNVGGAGALIGPLAWYVLTVLAGLAIHGLIVLPLILWLIGRTNPYTYMGQMRQALMTAFGTDSSSATLPVTMECAEGSGQVSKKSSGFVLPLGATVNMDGTALYEATAAVFLFQCYGIHLSPVELGIIVITATLAGVGAAGIPSAGLVTMVIVIQAVNQSLGSQGPALPLAAVGIIIGVDRMLDMCRTTVNVWGDAVGARLVSPLAPDG